MWFKARRSLSLSPNSAPLPPAAAEEVADRCRRRRGATAMEYLFVISLILIVALSAIGSFGQSTKNSMQKSSDSIQKATSGK
jgi:hypothetical protein